MKPPKMPKMPKELKSKFNYVKVKKGDKVVSFDPATRTRDMAKESMVNGEHGAGMIFGGKQ